MHASFDARIVPLRNINNLVDIAGACGIDEQKVLEGTGIDDLATAPARVSARELVRVYENLVAAGNPALGFESGGDSFDIANYGILGYAMMASTTLDRAVNIAMRYYRTTAPPFELEFDIDSRHVSISVADVYHLREEVLRLAVEMLFAPFRPLVKQLTGREIPPLRLELSYECPAHVTMYREHFQCPVIFGGPVNRIVYDASILGVPMVRADADSARLFEKSCRELLEEIEQASTLSNRVRQQMLSSPGSIRSADDAAAALRLGPRTLRRRLAAEGTSFKTIHDDVRTRIAIDFLTMTALTTHEIAELLGFTEATNFRRAFLRWTGRTPRSFRARTPS